MIELDNIVSKINMLDNELSRFLDLGEGNTNMFGGMNEFAMEVTRYYSHLYN